MAVTRSELSRFQEFAEAKVATGDVDSLESLFDQWLLAHPPEEQAAADLAAIERGIEDADAGRVSSVGQAFDNVRQRLLADP